MKPAFLHRIRAYYIIEYKDRFFSDSAPSWFTVFIVLEGLYHLPLSCWAIRAIVRGKYLIH